MKYLFLVLLLLTFSSCSLKEEEDTVKVIEDGFQLVKDIKTKNN